MKLKLFLIVIILTCITLSNGLAKTVNKSSKTLVFNKGNGDITSEETKSLVDSQKNKLEKTNPGNLLISKDSELLQNNQKPKKNLEENKSVYNLNQLIQRKEEYKLINKLKHLPKKIDQKKTLVYTGPLTVFCVKCERDFQKLASFYSGRSYNDRIMEGLGMRCISRVNSYCEIYKIAKIKNVPKDTEIAFIDFLKEDVNTVGDVVLVYLPLSPCPLCLSEIEIRMENDNQMFMHFYFKRYYNKLLFKKLNKLKMLQRPILTKIFKNDGRERINYKSILKHGINKRVLFTIIN